MVIHTAKEAIPIPPSAQHSKDTRDSNINKNSVFYYYESEETAIGWIAVALYNKDQSEKDQFYNINPITVDKRYQNKGLATRLVEYMISHISPDKIIYAAPQNEASTRLFNKFSDRIITDNNSLPKADYP